MDKGVGRADDGAKAKHMAPVVRRSVIYRETEKRSNYTKDNRGIPWWARVSTCAFTAVGLGSTTGQETEIPQGTWHGQQINTSINK